MTCDVIFTDFTIIIDLVLFIYFYTLHYLPSVDQSYASFLSRVLRHVDLPKWTQMDPKGPKWTQMATQMDPNGDPDGQILTLNDEI